MVWRSIVPSASEAASALPTFGRVGISAGANQPERASAS